MSPKTKVRLLYAEDDQDTREMICVLLEKENFEVVCPQTGQDFLQRARDERWDLYMLDSWMPGLSGLEICARIREFDSQTPIVFYSAAAFESDKKKAFACGAKGYMVKPIPFDELVKGIYAAIELPPTAAGSTN
jgi:DNA-binding response OmpR family regulator